MARKQAKYTYKEQLEQIPDAILNFELSSNQKIKLALGEKIAFADNYDDWDYIFQKQKIIKFLLLIVGLVKNFCFPIGQ